MAEPELDVFRWLTTKELWLPLSCPGQCLSCQRNGITCAVYDAPVTAEYRLSSRAASVDVMKGNANPRLLMHEGRSTSTLLIRRV